MYKHIMNKNSQRKKKACRIRLSDTAVSSEILQVNTEPLLHPLFSGALYEFHETTENCPCISIY